MDPAIEPVAPHFIWLGWLLFANLVAAIVVGVFTQFGPIARRERVTRIVRSLALATCLALIAILVQGLEWSFNTWMAPGQPVDHAGFLIHWNLAPVTPAVTLLLHMIFLSVFELRRRQWIDGACYAVLAVPSLLLWRGLSDILGAYSDLARSVGSGDPNAASEAYRDAFHGFEVSLLVTAAAYLTLRTAAWLRSR